MIDSRKPLTVNKAAEKTRMSVSWWRKMVFEKKIKHLKIGRRVFIPPSVVDDLFENSIIEAQENK